MKKDNIIWWIIGIIILLSVFGIIDLSNLFSIDAETAVVEPIKSGVEPIKYYIK